MAYRCIKSDGNCDGCGECVKFDCTDEHVIKEPIKIVCARTVVKKLKGYSDELRDVAGISESPLSVDLEDAIWEIAKEIERLMEETTCKTIEDAEHIFNLGNLVASLANIMVNGIEVGK